MEGGRKDVKSPEKGGDDTETEAPQDRSVTKGGARTNTDTSSTLECSHEAPDQMGNQEAEAGEYITTTAKAESLIGASAAQNWEPEEGEQKGANTSDNTKDAEPKGATSKESK